MAEGSWAARLAAEIREVAGWARTEEDLKIEVEKRLEPALHELGIVARPLYGMAHKNTLLQSPLGFSDAVYGHAIIEYKNLGVLVRKAGLREAEKELRRYLGAEASKAGAEGEEEALRRMVGIGLDGRQIFFLRYLGRRGRQAAEEEISLPGTQMKLAGMEVGGRQGGWRRSGPYLVTEESIDLFLTYLRALRRRPLTPEKLAEEFGPEGRVAQEVVSALYWALRKGGHPQIETFYAEWNRLFGIVYGHEPVKAKEEARELGKHYGLEGEEDFKGLLFAVHTYYALLMKMLAAELVSLQPGSWVSAFVGELAGIGGEEMKARLEDLEDGGLFGRLGIGNFLEGDFFRWYLAAWKGEMETAVRGMAKALSEYEPATGSLKPEETKDLLKKLYEKLVPRQLRHDLGEYYTPDWLAEVVLEDVGYDGNPVKRVLDPGCGSGTFLVLAIKRAQEYAEDGIAWRGRERELTRKITANIVGFDLNPLAVIAARTNYLLALGNLRRHTPIEIPVYFCDSILTPANLRYREARPLEHRKDVAVPSVEGDFWVPERLVEEKLIEGLTRLLEECVRRGYARAEFLERARRELGVEDGLEEKSLGELFGKVGGLEEQGRNRIWTRIIKNGVAPIFQGKFDYVVGNPPWVNWESLADDYRQATKQLWQDYGLFSLRGHAARLGGGKKDLAMLMLYAAMDSYLKDGGKLGFVITQTVFKTKGAGDGFRRFRLGEAEKLAVLMVHDLVELMPFEGASNRTATVVVERGRETKYPVSYTVWRKKKAGRVPASLGLDEVKARTETVELAAEPIDKGIETSPWITARPAALAALGRAIGRSAYEAHAGACTWANGVYWLRVLERREDGLLVVENLYGVGKISVKPVQAVMEPGLVYPLLRGRDVGRWRAEPSAYILMVQDPEKRTGYEESWLRVNYPHTYGYLKQFEDMLRQRSGYRKYFDSEKDAFYSMYDVAEYTFAPYKVMWRQMVEHVDAVVTQPLRDRYFGTKVPVTQHVVTIVPFTNPTEAHYFCAAINSSLASFISASYSTSKSFGTPTLLEHIAIPTFEPSNRLHQSLSLLSQRTHQLAALGKKGEAELRQVEAEIDRLAARLWGMSDEELAEIQRALEEIG